MEKQREEKFWCSSHDPFFSRYTKSQSFKVVRPYDNIKERDEVKAAALKSYAERPSASSGASLDFALTSHASLLGVVYIKGGSFYYLNSLL